MSRAAVKKKYTTLLREIEAAKKRIGKERDKLRDLLSEAEEIVDNCDEAITNLDEAVEAMSRHC